MPSGSCRSRGRQVGFAGGRRDLFESAAGSSDRPGGTIDTQKDLRIGIFGACWRLVEAQHWVSTLPLVDTLEEQARLEQILEDTKPNSRRNAGTWTRGSRRRSDMRRTIAGYSFAL